MLSRVDAIVLAGGSAFGLGCSNGAMDELAARGVGMPTPYGTIPIVPTAVIFDIGIGQSAAAPTVEMARAATKSAAVDFAEGSAGAGYGATIGKLLGVKSAMKGGLGTAARHGEKGLIVGALAVVNAWGDIVEPTTARSSPGRAIRTNRASFWTRRSCWDRARRARPRPSSKTRCWRSWRPTRSWIRSAAG
jgi:L-aminopeptidase/D-esterase-like protein